MANQKKSVIQSEFETPFHDELLANIPFGFRLMMRKETDSIGELYRKVKFSQSERHQSKQYTNFPIFKPVSNIITDYEEDKRSE